MPLLDQIGKMPRKQTNTNQLSDDPNSNSSIGNSTTDAEIAQPQLPLPHLKQDKKKRKTWIWEVVIDKPSGEDQEDLELNNLGRARRSCSKRATEGISASLSTSIRKPVVNNAITKTKDEKRPPSSQFNMVDLDSSLCKEKEANEGITATFSTRESIFAAVKVTVTAPQVYEKIETDLLLHKNKESSDNVTIILATCNTASIAKIIENESKPKSPLLENEPKPKSSLLENEPKLNSSLPENEPKLKSSLPENQPKLKSSLPENEPKLKFSLPENEPKPKCSQSVFKKNDENMLSTIELSENITTLFTCNPIMTSIAKTIENGQSLAPSQPQYKKIDENRLLCKDAESKESKSIQCDCKHTKKELKQGIGCGKECLNRLLMMECRSGCPCGKYCTNRRFQRQQYATVNIFYTGAKGWGLKADADIFPGQFIIEYMGEVINSKEMNKRIKRYGRDPNHKHHYLMALRSGTVIDATSCGNESRFINHSCDPNAATQKWTVGRQLRIGFFALKQIHAGEEITFNYQFERYGRHAQKCLCGSEKCTGYIGASRDDSEGDSDDELESTTGSQISSSDEEEDELKGRQTSILLAQSKSTDQKTVKKRGRPRKLFDIYGAKKHQKDVLNNRDGQKKISPELISNPAKREQAEVDEVIRKGLRNRDQVLEFNRLMVRVDQMESRCRMIDFLLRIDDPNILRLFVVNQGLALIRIWFVLPSFKLRALQLQSQIARLLMRLPVTNKNQVDEACIMSTLKQMNSFELPDKFIVEKVVNELADSIAEKIDDITSEQKSIENPIVQEFMVLKDLSSKLADKWANLVDSEFKIPKKLIKTMSIGRDEGRRSRHQQEKHKHKRESIQTADLPSQENNFRNIGFGRSDGEANEFRNAGFGQTGGRNESYQSGFGRFDTYNSFYNERFDRHNRERDRIRNHSFQIRKRFMNMGQMRNERIDALNNYRQFYSSNNDDNESVYVYDGPTGDENGEFDVHGCKNDPPLAFFNPPPPPTRTAPLAAQPPAAMGVPPPMVSNGLQISSAVRAQNPPTMAGPPMVSGPVQQSSTLAPPIAQYYPTAPFYAPYYIQPNYPMPVFYQHNGMAIPANSFPIPPPPPPPPSASERPFFENTFKEVSDDVEADSSATNALDMDMELDQADDKLELTANNVTNNDTAIVAAPLSADKNKQSIENVDIKKEVVEKEYVAKELTTEKTGKETTNEIGKKKKRETRTTSVELALQRRIQSLKATLGNKATPSIWPIKAEGTTKDDASRSISRESKSSRSKSPPVNKRSRSRDKNKKKSRKEEESKEKRHSKKADEKTTRDVRQRRLSRTRSRGRTSDDWRGRRGSYSNGTRKWDRRQGKRRFINQQDAERDSRSLYKDSGKDNRSPPQNSEWDDRLPKDFERDRPINQLDVEKDHHSLHHQPDAVSDSVHQPAAESSTSSVQQPDAEGNDLFVHIDVDEDNQSMHLDAGKDNCSLEKTVLAQKISEKMILISDDDEDAPLLQPPNISVDILSNPDRLDDYIRQMEEFVTFVKTFRRDLHGAPLRAASAADHSPHTSSTNGLGVTPSSNSSVAAASPQIRMQQRQQSAGLRTVKSLATKRQYSTEGESLPNPSSSKSLNESNISEIKRVRLDEQTGKEIVQQQFLHIEQQDHIAQSNTPPEDPRITNTSMSLISPHQQNASIALSHTNLSLTSVKTVIGSTNFDQEINNSKNTKLQSAQKNDTNVIAIKKENDFIDTTEGTNLPSIAPIQMTTKSGLWLAARDSEGSIYFYHRDTREAVWELPQGEELLLDSTASMQQQQQIKQQLMDDRQKRRAEFKRKVSELVGKCIEAYKRRFFQTGSDYTSFLRKITHKVLDNQEKEGNPNLIFNDHVQKNTRRLVDDYIRHLKGRESTTSATSAHK